MKKIVFLTGAGMSAESGLETFRDSNGLWENYQLNDVASIDGWRRDPNLVQKFHNTQRRRVMNALPHKGHIALSILEKHFKVDIITQNVDDLHERAGSTSVLHLHGLITKAQSVFDPSLTYDIIGSELSTKDKCIHGLNLRPNVVWFGEPVLHIKKAKFLCASADILVVIGTSLNVLPAADLINEVSVKTTIYIIDPDPELKHSNSIKVCEVASIGIEMVIGKIIEDNFTNSQAL